MRWTPGSQRSASGGRDIQSTGSRAVLGSLRNEFSVGPANPAAHFVPRMANDALKIRRENRAAAQPVDRMARHERFVTRIVHEDQQTAIGNADLHPGLPPPS
jgi:hypothetical protein